MTTGVAGKKGRGGDDLMADSIVYLNGTYVKDTEATVSIFDRGFTNGDWTYDVTRTYGHKPFQLRDHIARLYRSLDFMQLDPGLSQDEMHDITLETVKRNEKHLGPRDDFSITHRVSRGIGGLATGSYRPTVLVHCDRIVFEKFAQHLVDGAHLVVASTRRIPPACLDPKVKNRNLNFVLADLEGKAIDPSAWVLLLDIYGFLSECTSKNIFLVRNGALFTPKRDNVLEGVTRGTMLQLASRLNIPYSEADLSVYDLMTSEEVFVTSVSPGMIPISKINDKPLKKPGPGPVTKQLMAAFGEMVGIDIVDQALSHLRVANRR
jgi:branched-chain amino acid aminotransferase